MKKELVNTVLSVVIITGLLASCGKTETSETDGGESEKIVDTEGYDFSNDQTFDITAGGIQSSDDLVTLAMQEMADIVSEKSDGTINITVSPASQLGDATSQMEAVSLGTQEIFVDAGSWLSTFVDDALVTSMFFLFEDADHYKAFLESTICADMEQQLIEQEGIRIIANNWLRAPRSIVSAVEINAADDLEGLKMRVPDIKSYMESATALGLGTAQVAWGETYLALQQGVVDACEAPLDSIYTMKFYETTNRVTLTEHIRDNAAVYMNDDLYNQMSDAQKQVLSEAAKEAGEWYTTEIDVISHEYKEIMESEGTVFAVPSDAAIADMTEVVAERAKELEREGLWKEGLFEGIRALAQ